MNAAVYVDFENLYHSLKSRSEQTGLRTREICLQILDGLLSRLREAEQPVVLGRSYAAFDTYPGSELAHDLALMGLDPQYVLSGHSGKNSADVQLALDVARILYRRADIELIVIVSGDRDFIPLARLVLEEGRELRVVAIPQATSGDLLARVGPGRFWNALDLIQVREVLDDGLLAEATDGVAAPANAAENEAAAPRRAGADRAAPVRARADKRPVRDASQAVVVGHIPVTWDTGAGSGHAQDEALLHQCLELMMRSRLRHGSDEIWLSPFLKGPMSQHFAHIVHPERRALINELRSRGVIRVEERENLYADHPYSVIVIDDDHPLAREVAARIRHP